MKFFNILLCMSLFMSHLIALAVPSSDNGHQSLSLRGKVEAVEVDGVTSEEALIKIKLKMELTNTGTVPVLLLNNEPLFVGASLARSPNDLVSGVLLASSYAGPAVDKSPYWGNLRASLEQTFAPSENIRVLKPNESWLMGATVVVGVPAQTGGSISFQKKESWPVIQKFSPVWLSVICEVWPRNIEPGDDRSKLKFGYKLQKRWSNYGVLRLDDLISEPIQLDLKDVSQKP